MNDSQPNVLLIHAHDIGQYLGCYGVDIETPHVDALADAGALFERHFATAPQCSPSRGSLMTGRVPTSTALWASPTATGKSTKTNASCPST